MSEAELRLMRKKVTMVFQSGALFDSLTVGENIEFSLELREDYDQANREDEVVRGLLTMVDLEDYADPLSHAASRRATNEPSLIARALAAQPECILMTSRRRWSIPS